MVVVVAYVRWTRGKREQGAVPVCNDQRVDVPLVRGSSSRTS